MEVTKMKCKNCGKDNKSKEEDLLCESCRMTFGHSLYSEL
jgi:Zn finger protein HypA/HybF involved in hydrogenase expression